MSDKLQLVVFTSQRYRVVVLTSVHQI